MKAGDALIVVDVQNDFCPGGALPVLEGDRIVAEINGWIGVAVEHGIPVFVSRDWHPLNHISFKERGGPWPPHCVKGTSGAEFYPGLRLPPSAVIISKATDPERESYSAFGNTDLADRLRSAEAKRLWICGLALDYCVKETAAEARKLGYEVHVVANATRAVDVQPGDGQRALEELKECGVIIEYRHARDAGAV